MRIAIIGRTEILYDTTLLLASEGYQISCILSAKEAPEYRRSLRDFEALARSLSIPFAQGAKIEDHASFLRSANADIAVSINYTGIVPQSVIDLFRLGILNAHGGDLPRYRGNACQAWAILNGESRIGLCVHRMIGGELDSGDILARDYLPISAETKVTEAWDWMCDRTPSLFLEAIRRIESDPHDILESQSRDAERALRCYPRRPEDGRIDWRIPAIQILRLINASNRPYAGAFCELDGGKVVIWDACLVKDEERYCAVPGQVLLIGGDWIDVACGEGKLRLRSVEIDGKIAPPSEFVRSIRKRFA